jgi:hypothetical protein
MTELRIKVLKQNFDYGNGWTDIGISLEKAGLTNHRLLICCLMESLIHGSIKTAYWSTLLKTNSVLWFFIVALWQGADFSTKQYYMHIAHKLIAILK